MRRIAIGTVVLSFALVSMAWAGAKDKSSNTVVDINATGVLNNTTAKTKIASTKPCALQVQMQTLSGVSDGDVVICVADADLDSPVAGGNGVIVAGEIKAGKINFKANLAEVDVAGTGCGDAEAISYNGGIRCFLDDPTYRGDANVAGSWRADCAAQGGLTSGAPGATKLKVNNTQSIVVGLCQTFTLGTRLAGPATSEFARTGQRTPVVAP
jgi:hypothetical protein